MLISDCGADPTVAFDDLGNALRRIREDFGVDISLDVAPLRPGADGLSRQHVAVGTIHYSPTIAASCCTSSRRSPETSRPTCCNTGRATRPSRTRGPAISSTTRRSGNRTGGWVEQYRKIGFRELRLSTKTPDATIDEELWKQLEFSETDEDTLLALDLQQWRKRQ